MIRGFFKIIALLSLTLMVLFSNLALAAQLSKPSEMQASEMREQTRLKALGFKGPLRVYLRLFKEEKLLEIWLKSEGRYKLYKSFDICKYSGKLGPKFTEGDKQAPEGFYHVPAEDVLWNSRKWPRALNLAFPNIYDGLSNRTGSYLLIHGGCTSAGCYALKNGPMSLLYDVVSIALKQGQQLIPIHIFPFRLSQKNWERHTTLKDKSHKKNLHKSQLDKSQLHKFNAQKFNIHDFWKSLQPVYDQFNKSLTLPSILVCQSGYKVNLSDVFMDDPAYSQHGCLQPLPLGSEALPHLASLSWVEKIKIHYKKHLKGRRNQADQQEASIWVNCNLKRPSCRRWLALRKRMLKRGTLPRALLRH